MARRRSRDTGPSLTARQRTWLLTGLDWTFLDPEAGPLGSGGFDNLRDARKAWEALREDLLEFWLQRPETWPGEHSFRTPRPRGPGTRPWAWWRFDAEVGRAVRGGSAREKAELRALGWFTDAAWRDFFGDPTGGHLKVESEGNYLARHGLERPEDNPPLPGPELVE